MEVRVQMPDDRFQIFISSTFNDLRDERKLVSETILDMNHFPAGMELFPATDSNQMNYIQKVIDQSDYYVLIIGGKYGSTDESGISFTELEYQYAVKQEIPILAFIHNDIGSIKSSYVDNGELAERLEAFKEKVSKGRLVKYWSQKEELALEVMKSLNAAFKDFPKSGWQRGTHEPSKETLLKINKLQERADYYFNAWIESSDRLKEYESLANREVEINYTSNHYENGQNTFSKSLSSEILLKHFAAALNSGIDRERINDLLHEIVSHKFDSEVTRISLSSVENVLLFFQVYEVVEKDEGASLNGPFDVYTIRKDKEYLLKSAFKRSDEMNLDYDDEVPF